MDDDLAGAFEIGTVERSYRARTVPANADPPSEQMRRPANHLFEQGLHMQLARRAAESPDRWGRHGILRQE